jgi:hypothetical protein
MKLVKFISSALAFFAMVACGGGGGSSSPSDPSSVGAPIVFPTVRSAPVPTAGGLLINSSSDVTQWARTANTGVNMVDLVYGVGIINFSEYANSFSRIAVGTSTSNTSCAGGGSVSGRFVKQSAADISAGDSITITYNNCISSPFRYNGSVTSTLLGANTNGSFAVRYSAAAFSATDIAATKTFASISGIVDHSLRSDLNAYSASQLTGAYTTASTQEFESGTYTINNVVVSIPISAGVPLRSFGMDVIGSVAGGSLSLKADTRQNIFGTGTQRYGLVQILRSGYLSKVEVNFVSGNARVDFDQANNGVTPTQLTVPMF